MLEQEVRAYDYEDARMPVSELAEKTGKCDCRHSELNTINVGTLGSFSYRLHECCVRRRLEEELMNEM